MKKNLLAIWILMASVGPGLAQPAPEGFPAAPAATRDPELLQIDGVKDAALLTKRIEAVRKWLPMEFRKRNNFAWAVAKIDGLDKVEYFAHSGIQDFDGLSSDAQKRIAEISLKPAKGRFKTLCVNQRGVVEGDDCWQRNVDTEYKILEDMASRLPDTSVSGRMRLYTELYPCPSCWNVMKQFLAVYTNIQMQVLYRKP